MASFAIEYGFGTLLNETFCLSDRISDAMVEILDLNPMDEHLLQELTESRSGWELYLEFVKRRRASGVTDE